VAAPARRIAVCAGSKCRRAGGDALLAAASGAAAAAAASSAAGPAPPGWPAPPSAAVEVGACKCLGKCKRGPAVRVEEPDGTTVVLTGVGSDEVQRLVFASAPLFF
jgi:(2Fe-2S) ferredoxin